MIPAPQIQHNKSSQPQKRGSSSRFEHFVVGATPSQSFQLLSLSSEFIAILVFFGVGGLQLSGSAFWTSSASPEKSWSVIHTLLKIQMRNLYKINQRWPPVSFGTMDYVLYEITRASAEAMSLLITFQCKTPCMSAQNDVLHESIMVHHQHHLHH